ncbi:MAG TPA: mucoidy inhibitor MuiA family protein [Phycisphaerales bacterium]|nr:mucoidy inhibitor MuiA family protein [Phycisphaerales bacterium]
MKVFVLAAVAGSVVSCGALAQVRGEIEGVTVYRGQALVTRAVDLGKGGGGVEELVVTDLPPTVRAESLHAEAPAGVSVRSVRFRARPVEKDTREEVRAVDARITELQDKQRANARRVELLNEHRAYLASLQGFVAPTATAELSRGVLNAETLERLSTYIRTERAKMAETELNLVLEARDLGTQLDAAQRERATIAGQGSRTVYEAVVLVSREGNAAAGPLRLRYLVDGASWTPSYSLRVDDAAAADTVRLEYYASIQQMSGEDWNGVSMTLSTATPSLIANAPSLSPITLTLQASPQAALEVAYADAKRELEERQREIFRTRASKAAAQSQTADPSGAPASPAAETASTEADLGLNQVANDMLLLDVVSGRRDEDDRGQRRRPVSPSEEGLSVTYSIAGRTTLPSRSDRQLVQIGASQVPATTVKIAAPALTTYVYNQAQAVNTTGMVLLAGPMTSYVNGAFVGSGFLPTTAAGQAFEGGLGIDSSLLTRRELVNRTESVQGGNKVIVLTYRLTVENFGEEPARVRLVDRLPRAQQGTDIRVSMLSSQIDPASDPEARRQREKDGIVRWDLDAPAAANGQKALSIEYTYQVEHDRQMSLGGI